jgi:hypothetical protein
MRRREEKLAFWLSGRDPSPKSGRIAWLKKLHSQQFKGVIKDRPLDIRSLTISLDDAIPADTRVLDGLGMLSVSAPPAEMRQGAAALDRQRNLLLLESEPAATSKDIHEPKLLPAAAVRSLAMPDAQKATIRQGRLIPPPNTRSTQVGFNRLAVRSLESFRDHPVEIKDGRQALLEFPAIRTAEQISRFPHRRKSVDLEMLSDLERSSFLHEAQVLKRVPADRAELLAVFRSIPIELILRLRYLAGRKELLYSIAGGSVRTRTNVHDMAAIRDSANQEVHMVPHRTKSRPVFLA